MRIILASASPRRKELLKLILDDFEIISADIDETLDASLSADKQVISLAEKKALRISEKEPDALVIGADTMVFLDKTPFGKPADENEAKAMLSALSGKVHSVITAAAFAEAGKLQSSFAEETKVEFYPMTKEEIENYVKTGEPMGKAGAYAVQGKAALFVKRISGDFYNVMGLPVSAVYRRLNALLDFDRARASKADMKE